MTKINKIVMQGFKSFAKRTEIIFDDQYNCILGPNGSGKSNVLDAICFVLGKSSAKGLRAEKSGNLVYNGGKAKNPAKEGRVSIYFDNTKRTFPTDEQEVKITRVVRGDGASKYLINDKVRTRTQIIDALALAKIDPDGYNIVLQGDIVKFVELSSIEKRKLIEEVAGISIYDERRDKAVRELEKFDAKIGEAEIVLKERKAYLHDLKGDRDQALKYKELNDKIKTNKASYLQIQIDKKESVLKETDERIAKHKKSFDEYQDKIKKAKEDVENRRSLIGEISKEVEEKGEKDQVAMQKEIETLRVQIATNKTKVGAHENELQRISHRKQQILENVTELDKKIDSYTEKKDTLQNRRDRRKEEFDTIKSKIDDFKKKHKLAEGTEEMDKKVDEIDTECDKLQQEIQTKKEAQQELIREQDKIDFQLKSIEERIIKVKEVEKEHKAELQNLKNMRSEFKTTTLELNKKLDESSRIAAELGKAESDVHIYREELAKLNARDASIKEKMTGNIAVQKVLEKKGEIPGIFGTVAELGQVDSKYALALEVAAGPRLRSIVVKDDAVAAQCIKYLKTARLGSATFLPLNKIKAPEGDVSQFSKAQGSFGKAIDLIRYNPQYKKAFAHVFGTTIIVDNIDVARRIGVGTVRMATLTGDLVEVSGAMQGGFRAQQKSGSAFKDQKLSKRIEELEAEISDLTAVISSSLQRKRDNEEHIVKLRETKAHLEGEIIKVEKGLHLNSDDMDASMNLQSELESRKKRIDQEIDDSISDVSQINRKLAMKKVERQKVKEQIVQLRNPRLLAELNTFEEKRQQLTQEIMQIESEIKSIDTQVKEIFGRDQENSGKVIKNIEKEEESFQKEIKNLEQKTKDDQNSLKEKEAKLEEFYKKFKSLFAKRSKLNDEIAGIEKVMFQSEEKGRTEEYKINTLSLEQAKVKTEMGALLEEFVQYRDVPINKKKDEAELKREISEFERMRDKIGNVNLRALEIYDSVEQEYNKLIEKKETLLKEKTDVLGLIEEIEGKKKELFLETHTKINDNFMKVFSQLSKKGEAYLEIENPDKPFEAGVVVRVRLSGTKFMDIRSLSGGEKTLTTLSFIFAIQEFDPATFYVMDEVDAALDKRNAELLAKLVKSYSDRAQYVIISHNDAVITEATTLYGVSMDKDGISKVVSLKV